MCIAIPSKIVEIRGVMATVDTIGQLRQVSLAMVDNVEVGDYLVVSLGYAVRCLSPEEAEMSLEIFREIAEHAGIA